MSETVPSTMEDNSLSGEALANNDRWRSVKAKQQIRDRFGRWISQGANVRWRDPNGTEMAGIVTSTVNGVAYVTRTAPDGTKQKHKLDPKSLRVLASKATLPTDKSVIHDPKNNFARALELPAVKSSLAENPATTIQRADGYALEISQQNPKPTNPVLYQLYAPGGKSLGRYGEEAAGDFDAMVAEDQGSSEGTVPEGSGGEGVIVASGEDRPYRVPAAVSSEIQASLASLATQLLRTDLATATRLATEPSVSLSDVEWVHGYFQSVELDESLRGGFRGKKWATKIVSSPEDDAQIEGPESVTDIGAYVFDDDTYCYFATGLEAGSSLSNGLIAVDYDTGAIYIWTHGCFDYAPDLTIDEYDVPQITPVDGMTAEVFAQSLDSGVLEFDILDSDTEERNLFILAESEIDFGEIDRGLAIIADASGYTPMERSANAKKQQRASGGKFGEQPDNKAIVAEQGPAVKATLPMELPLVVDPAARIAEFMETAKEAPVLAAAEPVEAEAPSGYPEEEQAVEDAATGPTGEAIYFAVVDPVDKTAVMDAIAIVKKNGHPEAWQRTEASWQLSADYLAQLNGSTPPPVVELNIPEPVKTVLAQIDDFDSGKDMTPDGEPVTATGFALFDGSLSILDVDDLNSAVTASAGTEDTFVKAHIRKRARALNRMDLIPESWRSPALHEIGELSASELLYGEFGEILPITAGGVPGIADTPGDYKNAQRLKAYWTHGKGSLKIRWSTPGDLTRAHRHLEKYVPGRGWALAQSYHKYLFGVSNITHDRATGQYRAPKRRR